MRETVEWKYSGDGAMKAKRFMEAVGFYKQALQRDPLHHAIYSNRSMALLKLNQAAMALEDARWYRRLAPWSVKGCYREVMARMAMVDSDRASQVFWTAYCMDNENYETAELFKEAVAKAKAVPARERGESVSGSEDEDEAAGGSAHPTPTTPVPHFSSRYWKTSSIMNSSVSASVSMCATATPLRTSSTIRMW